MENEFNCGFGGMWIDYICMCFKHTIDGCWSCLAALATLVAQAILSYFFGVKFRDLHHSS